MFIDRQQFYLVLMPEKNGSSHKCSSSKNSKYDDWICLFCQNHNYSFRQICNRCHIQTKQQNAYMTLLYQQQLQLAHQHTAPLLLDQTHQLYSQDLFPNVVLLMINDDPWQQYPQIWQTNKPLNVKWINNLIEE